MKGETKMNFTSEIGMEQYMGKSYQERLSKITDKNAANAFAFLSEPVCETRFK